MENILPPMYPTMPGLAMPDLDLANGMASMYKDMLQYERPQGLSIIDNPLAPDPTLPDLQHLDFRQEVQMPVDERPGSLDPTALAVMDPATAAQVADKNYPEVFMDQRGMNDARVRHMTLLMRGLREEI